METTDEVFASVCLHNMIAVDVTPILPDEATEDGFVMAHTNRNLSIYLFIYLYKS